MSPCPVLPNNHRRGLLAASQAQQQGNDSSETGYMSVSSVTDSGEDGGTDGPPSPPACRPKTVCLDPGLLGGPGELRNHGGSEVCGGREVPHHQQCKNYYFYMTAGSWLNKTVKLFTV